MTSTILLATDVAVTSMSNTASNPSIKERVLLTSRGEVFGVANDIHSWEL